MHIVYKYYTNMPVNKTFGLEIGLPGTTFDVKHTESCASTVSLIFSQVFYRCTRKALHMYIHHSWVTWSCYICTH